MTDPIRIPITRQIHLPGVPYESIEITPDLARRIVELAGIDITTTNPDGSLKPVALRVAADGSVVSADETGHDGGRDGNKP